MRQVQAPQPEAPKQVNTASFFGKLSDAARQVAHYLWTKKAEPYVPERTAKIEAAGNDVSGVMSAMKPSK